MSGNHIALHGITAAIVYAAVFPLLAFAHATPVGYLPAELSVIAEPPEEIAIRFSERVEPSASSMKLFSPEGKELLLPAVVDPMDSHRLVSPVATLLPERFEGIYTVSWQVVSSDDGHFTKGAFQFAIGNGFVFWQDKGKVEMVHSASIFEATTIAMKLVGESMILGLLMLVFFFGRFGQPSEALRSSLLYYGRNFLCAGGTLLLGGGAAYFILKAFNLAAVQESSIFAALPKYAGTTGGEMTIALFVCLFTFMFLGRGILSKFLFKERISWKHWIALLALLGLSYTQARLSHAAASHILPTFSVFMNIPHLIGKGLWIGGLLALVFVFFPALKDLSNQYPDNVPVARRNVRRTFGFAVALAALLAGPSGAWIVWLHLKGVHNIPTSPWGGVFVYLLLFAALLGLLRFMSLYILERTPRCLNCERSFLTLESLVGLAVSFFSALIIITSPPLTYAPLYTATSSQGGNTVHLADPGLGQQMLHIFAVGADGGLIAGATSTVTLTNRVVGIGPIVVHPRERNGMYELPTSLFSPPGSWEIGVTLARESAYDVNGKFTLDYPTEIELARSIATHPTWNGFARAMLLVAIAMLGLSVLLFFLARRNDAYAASHPEIFVASNSIDFWRGQLVAILAFLLLILAIEMIHAEILGGGIEHTSLHGDHAL